MEKPRSSLADFLVVALSPALIMVLVGSLVFFLLEILYSGQYYANLQWILFFFVFAAVLIARISMQDDIAQHAWLYASVLGLLVWVALLRFVDFPESHPASEWAWAINLGLIALIWWCAHRLTRDCTFVDDAEDASGSGLMEGINPDGALQEEPRPELPDVDDPGERGLLRWWRRYRRFTEERRKKPHAPGTWVVYFSFAALPLYGLGQTQIPVDEAERRRYAYHLLLAYCASGLGLLLTTCFLGLRRYLRQRKLRMPVAMTGVWLMSGSVMIGLMLLGSAVLPRPGASTPLLMWTGLFGSPDLDPAEQGLQNKRPGGDENGAAPSDPSDREGNEAESKRGNAQRREKDDPNRGASRSGSEKKDRGSANNKGDNKAQGPGGQFFNLLATLLKWLVLAIFSLVILFVVLRSGLRFLANFTFWARRWLAAFHAWWEGFLARWKKPASADEPLGPNAPSLRPWRHFHDPFLTGRADSMSSAQLVQYTYDALESWANECDLGRQPRETPLEFAERLSDQKPKVAANTGRLADWYAHVAYARGRIPSFSADSLRELWLRLAETSEPDHEALHR